MALHIGLRHSTADVRQTQNGQEVGIYVKDIMLCLNFCYILSSSVSFSAREEVSIVLIKTTLILSHLTETVARQTYGTSYEFQGRRTRKWKVQLH